MSAEFAPGPWKWHPCYDPSGKNLTSLDISPADGHSLSGVAVVASVWGGQEANANLIAAAPELLSAAEEVLNPKASLNRALQRLRSVCAKARSEA